MIEKLKLILDSDRNKIWIDFTMLLFFGSGIVPIFTYYDTSENRKFAQGGMYFNLGFFWAFYNLYCYNSKTKIMQYHIQKYYDLFEIFTRC